MSVNPQVEHRWKSVRTPVMQRKWITVQDQQDYKSFYIKLSGDLENNFRSQLQARRTSQHQNAAYNKVMLCPRCCSAHSLHPTSLSLKYLLQTTKSKKKVLSCFIISENYCKIFLKPTFTDRRSHNAIFKFCYLFIFTYPVTLAYTF